MAAPKSVDRPTLEQLDRELARRKHSAAYQHAIRGTVWALVVVAAVAVICVNYFISALRVQGDSMSPTLQDGEIIVAVRDGRFETGDLVAFYYGNKILIKRVIACPGQWVEIDEDGNVSVDSVLLDEPYLTEKSLGVTDLDYPFQVPDNQYFVMGDHRSVSVDSRCNVIGCVEKGAVIGRVAFRVWPFTWFNAFA